MVLFEAAKRLETAQDSPYGVHTIVCHCHRADDTVIRIVSARKADKREEAEYWNRR